MAAATKPAVRMATNEMIVLFDDTDLNGKKEQFRDSVPDLGTVMFRDRARSLKVEGKHWVAYKQTDYKGEFVVYGDGNHNSLGHMDKAIRSLRRVTEDLQNPNIILYEHVDYKGTYRDIDTEVEDLKSAGFDEMVSSHQVKQGVWILYEDVGFNGNRAITFKGDNWPNYCDLHMNDKISSLKPLKSSDVEV